MRNQEKRPTMPDISDTSRWLKEIKSANQQRPTEFDAFCESLAIQLNGMPVRAALQCQCV